jgi:Uma2 family endonuclease
MASPAPKANLTPAEWRAWEERQPERWELVHDEPTLMAGGTARHNDITINIATALRARLRGKPCRVYMTDLKVLHPSGRWTYPDVVVRCGERLSRETGFDDPVVIVEVLSPGTENYDLQAKRWLYAEMASLKHLVFVAQNRSMVELVTRAEDGSWRSVFLTELTHAVRLDAIGAELSLAEIYDEIPFPRPSRQATPKPRSRRRTTAARGRRRRRGRG